MFDIGFFEIAFLSLVALLVLGPERLPQVARTVGGLVRRARAMMRNVREEFDREIATDDWKREIERQREQLKALQDKLDAEMKGHEHDSRDRASSGESDP